MAQPYDFISKIVSLGDSGSGKSMLAARAGSSECSDMTIY